MVFLNFSKISVLFSKHSVTLIERLNSRENTRGVEEAMLTPENLQIIGNEIAIAWSDGSESYFPMAYLRARSPSAENRGETDIFGRKYGGTNRTDFDGVEVVGWQFVGNYAVRFEFSDGHNTGLYSFSYLKELEHELGSGG